MLFPGLACRALFRKDVGTSGKTEKPVLLAFDSRGDHTTVTASKYLRKWMVIQERRFMNGRNSGIWWWPIRDDDAGATFKVRSNKFQTV